MTFLRISKNPLLPAIVFASVGFISTASAQELAPDDPTISAGLALWLRDAGNTFDEVSGTWADSSGNGNDATTVGEVSVNAPQTWLAPTLVTTGGGNFSVEDVSALHFAGDVNDLLATESLNGDSGFENITIIAVFNSVLIGGTSNLTRPLGIGSVSATQANPGDHINLSSEPSIRKDNGQIGSGLYSQVVPVDQLFIRSFRMSPTRIDDWFNTDGTLTNVFNVEGASYITSVDEFYLGDLRGGNDPVPGFGAATAQSDFDIVQVLCYNTALTDQQVAGINEWLANNIGTPAPRIEFEINAIGYDSEAKSATITWNSKPGRSYSVEFTDGDSVWAELDDGIESMGETTSFTEEGLDGITRRFYRVLEN